MDAYTMYRYDVQEVGGSRRGAGRAPDRRSHAGLRRLIGVAWEALGAGGGWATFEGLPDPTRHPECWFRII